MPTFHCIKNGAVVDEMRGADPEGLRQLIERNQEKSWGNGQSLGSAPASAPTSTNSVQPLEPLLDNLLGMGFEMEISKRALVATQNVGLEQAIDW